MKKQIGKLIVCAAVTATMLFSACCTPADKGAYNGAEKIIWPKTIKGIKVFSQPEDQVVRTNGMACFTVVAEPANLKNLQALSFQWQKNGSNIFGATGPTCIITNVQVYDVGFYSCIVKRGDASVKVGSVDTNAPGARLFVITGTNTAVSGPVNSGSGTMGCIGPYTGYVTFKNTSVSIWFKPPAGSTNCTITDTSHASSYVPVVEAVYNITTTNWCATNQVTFPVKSTGTTNKYSFTTYIKNTMPPPNRGDTLTLDINWFP